MAVMLLLEFNFALLFLANFIVYFLSIIFYRHYTKADNRKWIFIIAEMFFTTLIGPWFSFLLIFFFSVIVMRVFGYLWLRNEHFKKHPDLKLTKGQKIRAGFFRVIIFILMLALILFYIVAVVGRLSGLDLTFIISFIIASVLIVAWTIKWHVPFYNRLPTIAIKNKSVITIIIIFSSMIIISIMTASVNPKIPDAKIEIRTMSYNILYAGENGTQNMWMERRESLVQYMASLDLDVFGLQEVFRIQADYINETLLNRNYTWVAIGREPGGFGEHDAIFYDQDRFILLNNGTFWFSETPDVPSTVLTEQYKRTCTWVHLREKTTGTEFFFYNTHFGFYPEFHIRASIWLNQDISNRTSDLPVIVTGDFNMPPFFPFYSYLEGYGKKPLNNAYRIVHGYVNPSQIDYIFVTKDIHVCNCTILNDANAGEIMLSDHLP
ncbi:MAG: endonuclease/exonuclease/phosphatase family protein, partial [Promethearchaeota archaeon]